MQQLEEQAAAAAEELRERSTLNEKLSKGFKKLKDKNAALEEKARLVRESAAHAGPGPETC